MPQYEYAIAAGWDATDLDNIEDVMSHAPVADRLPMGSVKRMTLDRRVQYNGARRVVWRWAAMSRADFDILLGYLSDITLGSAPVTIKTPDHRDHFQTYNAYMVNPQPQTDWQRAAGGHGAVEGLQVEFEIIEQIGGALLLENGFHLLLETGDELLLESD